jgi:hypothetical protein
MDVIEEIKSDMEEIKSGTPKLQVLEQTVAWLRGEVERVFTGKENTTPAPEPAEPPASPTAAAGASSPAPSSSSS